MIGVKTACLKTGTTKHTWLEKLTLCDKKRKERVDI